MLIAETIPTRDLFQNTTKYFQNYHLIIDQLYKNKIVQCSKFILSPIFRGLSQKEIFNNP